MSPPISPPTCHVASVLIVDLEMPTMDGPELLERLKQCGIDVPIIVGSSHERVLIHAVQDHSKRSDRAWQPCGRD